MSELVSIAEAVTRASCPRIFASPTAFLRKKRSRASCPRHGMPFRDRNELVVSCQRVSPSATPTHPPRWGE
ncbi:MAG: hypothetical protein JW709_03560 [Sedimentisphaerales bacterium]|nr:hypothetical protein [Sedimentisphaerales bacterium]